MGDVYVMQITDGTLKEMERVDVTRQILMEQVNHRTVGGQGYPHQVLGFYQMDVRLQHYLAPVKLTLFLTLTKLDFVLVMI